MGESQAAAMVEERNCLRHGQEGARRRQPGSRFCPFSPTLPVHPRLLSSTTSSRTGLCSPKHEPTALRPRPLLHATDTSHNASHDAPKKTATDTSLDPEAPAENQWSSERLLLTEITTTKNNGRVGNLDGQAGVVRDMMLSDFGSMPPE